MHVLWVEDQYEDNQVFGALLEDRGDTVRWAGSVAEALALLPHEQFDLFIVDLLIPLGIGGLADGLDDHNYNGLHVLDDISSRSPETRIICLTNFDISELDGYNVTVLKKTAYLRDFEEAVYGPR